VMDKKIKVVWVCQLSNSEIRKHLRFAKWTPLAIINRIRGKNLLADFGVYNTNAIREFEKFDDIELHVIAPHFGIVGIHNFDINGIYYHFFHSENDTLLFLAIQKFFKKRKPSYRKNTSIILRLVDEIQPNIVHYIGAEIPHYSKSALSISYSIPLLVSLQTLMIDPDFFNNYPISKEEYEYRSGIELAILKRVDYVATTEEHFRSIIRERLGDRINFLDMKLAVGEKVNLVSCEKKYDFVYFAADISKAADYAIEAFAIAKRKYNNITLHVVGGYSEAFLVSLKKHMAELGLSEEVDFTGKLPTHNDVINEIRKARFALLPLKIDMISSTIRESMANGLPVITTITDATPDLNATRESVLLSEKGNYEAMATNMCKLLEDRVLEEMLRRNGYDAIQEKYNNTDEMHKWRECYYRIVEPLNN